MKIKNAFFQLLLLLSVGTSLWSLPMDGPEESSSTSASLTHGRVGAK